MNYDKVLLTYTNVYIAFMNGIYSYVCTSTFNPVTRFRLVLDEFGRVQRIVVLL